MKLLARVGKKGLLVWCGGFVSALLLLWLGASAVSGTSRTSFCLSCHEMADTGRELHASRHGRNPSGYVTQCAECHIAPGLAGLAAAKWKGLGELYVHVFHGGLLEGKAWGDRRKAMRARLVREMPQESCTRCHDLARMKPSTREGEVAHKTITPRMRCLDCHSVEGLRSLVHDPPAESL